MATWYETMKVERRERRQSSDVPLACINTRGPAVLGSEELPLIFLTRNDRKLLPAFLSHYRGLGVTRFICVDDASSDGSREFLLEQTDVDLWVSDVRFKEARRGRRWRERLFSLYGTDRWYVNVDSDEFLIYEGFGNRGLRSVIDGLEGAGFLRMSAPMLDMYPIDLESAEVEKLEQSDPWTVADHFDGDGYTLTTTKRAISVRGGPREREFKSGLELIKYPLIFWDAKCRFGPSIHQPLPYGRNFVPVMGVLLHFKFFADYAEVAKAAVEGGQYFNNSSAYSSIVEKMDQNGSLRLQSDLSRKYTGPDQLVKMGFFLPVPK
ncbi:glycosyltransferase family 2 protein [Rhizobium sp. Root1220]|uniref:glycosyltransferase family 2 protein n=1 Tax=Rhizobium sp. Root1220 TaxID=1736432 RepID=UPI0006F6995C|nr:glycosyltransferase family 2 protein [Rhizobium sp. Root1220]KQV83672.1 hypothetical protein ASC90_20135 [Rhizobium sp. Root1220]